MSLRRPHVAHSTPLLLAGGTSPAARWPTGQSAGCSARTRGTRSPTCRTATQTGAAPGRRATLTPARSTAASCGAAPRGGAQTRPQLDMLWGMSTWGRGVVHLGASDGASAAPLCSATLMGGKRVGTGGLPVPAHGIGWDGERVWVDGCAGDEGGLPRRNCCLCQSARSAAIPTARNCTTTSMSAHSEEGAGGGRNVVSGGAATSARARHACAREHPNCTTEGGGGCGRESNCRADCSADQRSAVWGTRDGGTVMHVLALPHAAHRSAGLTTVGTRPDVAARAAHRTA